VKRVASLSCIAALFAAGVAGQVVLSKTGPNGGRAVGEGVVAALGGLRSLAAEVVWFRAERLQEQGRHGELVQLAAMLTFLEPHEPEVWIYSAWNLAYNISVRMPREEDRWPWVYEGVKLLRDGGLAWNPRSAALCRELATLFELKIGTDYDTASAHYRREWRKIVEDVRSRGAWGELGMDAGKMAEVEREYGVSDWTDPQASALYWAREGLACADEKESPFLNEIVRISRKLYSKRTETQK